MRLSNLRLYLEGAGSRGENNKAIQGMSMKSLKKHSSLIPMFVIMGFAVTFVGAYIIRLATKSTDISWTKKPEPYNDYREKQFKFMNIAGRDFKDACKAPKYKD